MKSWESAYGSAPTPSLQVWPSFSRMVTCDRATSHVKCQPLRNAWSVISLSHIQVRFIRTPAMGLVRQIKDQLGILRLGMSLTCVVSAFSPVQASPAVQEVESPATPDSNKVHEHFAEIIVVRYSRRSLLASEPVLVFLSLLVRYLYCCVERCWRSCLPQPVVSS